MSQVFEELQSRGGVAVGAQGSESGVGGLPHPITFFVSGDERGEVLRALRRIHPDRAEALRRALRVNTKGARTR